SHASLVSLSPRTRRRHQRGHAAGPERQFAVRPQLPRLGRADQLSRRAPDHGGRAGRDAGAGAIMETGDGRALVGLERRHPRRRVHPVDDPAAALARCRNVAGAGGRGPDDRRHRDGPFRRVRSGAASGIDFTAGRHRPDHRRRASDQGLRRSTSPSTRMIP
ncbi:hypothetical protein chiPu_0032132, partial [Chiloscyllium punctatum]|nr:hypothetical protein [Chiloscyllium punctatum]